MELGLARKTAVVTGGSKGIGLETARGLAREGVRVMICVRRRSTLAEAVDNIHETTGGKVETHPLDVTDLGAIGELPKVIQQKLGGIERELAKRQLPDEEAGKMREQWSLNQASRNARWAARKSLPTCWCSRCPTRRVS
jgi:NAD(P)-dependent dehydrogenase (short-subunit alcohol dehydrogenase family)